jgi:phosphoglucosamine mutase
MSLAELIAGMEKFPQVLLNVRVETRYDPMQMPTVVEVLRRVEERLGSEGRVVLRASGTEPLIRVMVEAHEAIMAQVAAEEIASAVREVRGAA